MPRCSGRTEPRSPAAGGTCSTDSMGFGRPSVRTVSKLSCRHGPVSRQQRRQLMRWQTVADLADSVRHPHLSALVRSIAYGFGASPEETPALVAVELATRSTFGRWQIRPLTAEAALDAGRSSVLVEALAGRLEQRKVRVRLGTPVTGIHVKAGRVTGIRTATAELSTGAVVCTTDPWHTVDSLLPAELAKGM